MNLYILDTDILTLFREGQDSVCRHIASLPTEQIMTTVISVEEQLTGWYTLLRQVKHPSELAHAYNRLADAIRFVSRLQILTFPETAILRYQNLKSQKLNIGKMDLRIAAIVLEHGGILVTRNTRDFKRVPGLVLEDWSQ